MFAGARRLGKFIFAKSKYSGKAFGTASFVFAAGTAHNYSWLRSPSQQSIPSASSAPQSNSCSTPNSSGRLRICSDRMTAWCGVHRISTRARRGFHSGLHPCMPPSLRAALPVREIFHPNQSQRGLQLAQAEVPACIASPLGSSHRRPERADVHSR